VSRYEPDLTPSKDLAYVAGFYLGDGKDAGEEHKVRFELADQEQLVYVGDLVAKILGRDPKPLDRDGTFYTVQYDSVVLSDFLNQDIATLVSYFKDFIPDFAWVLRRRRICKLWCEQRKEVCDEILCWRR